MKPFLAVAFTLLSTLGHAFDTDGRWINVAIIELPPRYLADIPKEHRSFLISRSSSMPAYSKKIDYDHGYFHWFADGALAEESAITGIPGATSMVWVKLLPRDGRNPLVFVHMPKPYADVESTPDNSQTFVLERDGNDWIDVTADVIPEGVDPTMHFRPRRTKDEIQVASWEKFERRDGRGEAYRYGPRIIDLVWKEGQFITRQPDGEKLSWDSKVIKE